MEVRNAADIGELIVLTKQLLKREVTLQELFPNYRYTKADWEREVIHVGNENLHVHQVR